MDNCKPINGGHIRAKKNHYANNVVVTMTSNQKRKSVYMIRFKSEISLSKKMARLRRTARKSVPGGPYRVEGFRLPEQDPSSGSDSDSEISLTGTHVDPILPSSEEPVFVSSDPEEDPSESSEIPMQISPLRPDSETPAPEPESEMPKTVPVSVGGKLAQDRDFVYSRIPELGAL
ncbi:uncharacterized protein LOC141700179, partial [Apium graveolens]|uniref:uncharacterized protein LOC141700179 n=1 Tax=Apium graveolens TaxID=4045 RepID=UPI003D79D55F